MAQDFTTKTYQFKTGRQYFFLINSSSATPKDTSTAKTVVFHPEHSN